MSVYKLTAANDGTDGMASLDVIADGEITGMLVTAQPTGMDALGDYNRAEVSFSSSSSFTTNDVRASLIMAGVSQNFLTSGGGSPGYNSSVSGLTIKVNQGERIFLHGNISTGGGGQVTAYLYVNDGQESRPARRRR